jgi:peptide/nickel transport system substrate-binding protein
MKIAIYKLSLIILFWRIKMVRKVVVLVSVALLSILMSAYAGGSNQQSAPSGLGEKQTAQPALIGKLEGPEIIMDISLYPKTFKEAPILAQQVKEGKLPELLKRLPDPLDVQVIKPVHEVGKYGGNLRRAFTGPADNQNGNRYNNSDRLLAFDYTGEKIVPSLAKDWKVSDDGKIITLYLRKGAKWSDGQPFTADDFLFWWNDIYQNKDIVPLPFNQLQVNGKDGIMRKIDQYTITYEFPEPFPFFAQLLAGEIVIVTGHCINGSLQNWGGLFAPAHYLKQFLPKYSSEANVNQKAKSAGYDNWISYLKMKYSWALNPELPVMTPWVTVSPNNTSTWSMERNPYFWAVDTNGNQLPYIDRITMSLAENIEVVNLRTIAGDYDIQERHLALSKLPVFIENATKGNYTVHLDPMANGADAELLFGTNYKGDAEIRKWIQTKKFRNALSIGIDRDQLNEAFWLGLGKPSSGIPDTMYGPGPEYRKVWTQYDPTLANKMLDELGLNKKDTEGFRLRTDGKGRLYLEMATVGGQFIEYTKMGEMIKQHWRKIGIDLDVKEMERSLVYTRAANDETQIIPWTNAGSELLLFTPAYTLPVDPTNALMGGSYAQWYSSNGKSGERPAEPEMIRAMDLLRKGYATIGNEQLEILHEIWKIVIEQCWAIGTVGESPAFQGVRVVKNNMGNIPERQINGGHCQTPFTSQPATWYFK